MSDSLSNSSIIAFSKMHRLQWEPSQNKHVILYPEGMVELSDSAAEILKLCDGERCFGDIVTALEDQFSVNDLAPEVSAFLHTALEKNWVKLVS